MKTLLALMLAFCLVITSCSTSSPSEADKGGYGNRQGDLGNGYFLNPILGGDYPDPTIIRDGDDYYMTHSSFDYLPGLVVFHSKDLVNWQPVSFALKEYLGSVWAPDIVKSKDKFYIYFTVSNSGYSNYVVWADTPYGPWSEPIDLKVGNIDPCYLIGEDGVQWMFLSGGNRVKLSDDGLSVIPGTMEKVYKGWQYPEEWVTEGFCLEGPKMKKIGDYYYLLSAQGGTAGPPTSHMVVVARSKSVDGPWENDPNSPLIRTYKDTERWWSKGHGSLIDTPDGEWWIVYHAYENQYTNMGRQTLLEPIEITEDGWLKAPLGTAIEQPIRKPITSQIAGDRRERLTEFRVGLDWRYYKKYDPKRLSVNNNVLTMKAQGVNPAESAPLMFIAGAHSYEFSTKVNITDQVNAGLVIYYNAGFYVGISFDREKKYRWRRGQISGKSEHTGRNDLWLKLRNEKNVITGFISYDGKEWIKQEWGNEISGYNHNTLSDFQSILPGIFAYGEGEAIFSHFEFKLLE